MESHKHTKTQARKIGAYKALKYTLIVFLAFEAWMLYLETRGDFANGILFFMQEQMNSLILSVVFLLFLCAFVLGRWAGIKILMEGKSHVLMAKLQPVVLLQEARRQKKALKIKAKICWSENRTII